MKNAVYGYIVGNLAGVPHVGKRRGEFKVAGDLTLANAWSEDVMVSEREKEGAL